VSENQTVQRESVAQNQWLSSEQAPFSECAGVQTSPGERAVFYEFFAGGGMARLGLGGAWRCVYANDNCSKKAASYRANFRHAKELDVRDVAEVTIERLPGRADLMWGSFPCQDLSLAGQGAGLDGRRSGTFWPFMELVDDLGREGREPRLIVLENVVGALTSHSGMDFCAIIKSLVDEGYAAGALVVDSVLFVPQSRPRLFVVAVSADVRIPERLRANGPSLLWHPKNLRRAYSALPGTAKRGWVWWDLPAPPQRTGTLLDLVEQTPQGVRWHTEEQTARLLSLMSSCNLDKVRRALASGTRMVGAVYKRTRREDGVKRQRAEVRFDGISGCLRTPAGGSSRQELLFVEEGAVRTRLLSAREAARLMGVPDSYGLPSSYNEAYHLMGDALVVPVVSWIEQHLLRPLVRPQTERVQGGP